MLLAERLGQAATDVCLDQADLARILGASPRTVGRWLHAETAPRRDTRERILELVAVLDALSKTVHGQSAYDWLYSPIPALRHRKPAIYSPKAAIGRCWVRSTRWPKGSLSSRRARSQHS